MIKKTYKTLIYRKACAEKRKEKKGELPNLLD